MDEQKSISRADPRTNANRLDRLLGNDPMRFFWLLIRTCQALRAIDAERPVTLQGESVVIGRRDAFAAALAEMAEVAARHGIGVHDRRRPRP